MPRNFLLGAFPTDTPNPDPKGPGQGRPGEPGATGELNCTTRIGSLNKWGRGRDKGRGAPSPYPYPYPSVLGVPGLVLIQQRSTSATLQAWATQPRGV